MARPRADLPPAADIRALIDGQGALALQVTPGARTESIALDDVRLLVKVRARPEDGAANEAVLNLLATALAIPRSALVLLRGATSRDKLVRVLR